MKFIAHKIILHVPNGLVVDGEDDKPALVGHEQGLIAVICTLFYGAKKGKLSTGKGNNFFGKEIDRRQVKSHRR